MTTPAPPAPEPRKQEYAITPQALRQIGEVLYGSYWQTNVSMALGNSKSMITRMLDTSGDPQKSRGIPAGTAKQLQTLISERLGEIAKLMLIEGMPYAGDPQAQADVQQIVEIAKRYPGAALYLHGKPRPSSL